MEINKLITALEETIALLQSSLNSDWGQMTVEEIIQALELQITETASSQTIDSKLLSQLFVPTGAIQEVSIENGWGDDCLRIAEVVDEFTGNR